MINIHLQIWTCPLFTTYAADDVTLLAYCASARSTRQNHNRQEIPQHNNKTILVLATTTTTTTTQRKQKNTKKTILILAATAKLGTELGTGTPAPAPRSGGDGKNGNEKCRKQPTYVHAC